MFIFYYVDLTTKQKIEIPLYIDGKNLQSHQTFKLTIN